MKAPDVDGNEHGEVREISTEPRQTQDNRDSNDRHNTAANASERPTKRKKVHHACLYCRRSHMTCDLGRPCNRCLKRDIGHLCHDEVPTTAAGKTTGDDHYPVQVSAAKTNFGFSAPDLSKTESRVGLDTNSATALRPPNPSDPIVRDPQYISEYTGAGRGLDPFGAVNAIEVTNEYNLLGDFLNTSLLDDGLVFDSNGILVPDTELFAGARTTNRHSNTLTVPGSDEKSGRSAENSTGGSLAASDVDARDNFYFTAADPAGNDPAEDRMNRLLQAKYDAGMLKPFNYVNGYARLNLYMEKHMKAASRHKILRQLEKFRPKFREAMQGLTDIQLVKVEMWFERSLMEYDRVFASMALPACCWRRTGEIFRGNKEMAELINVPIELFHDGQLAIHDIIGGDSLVNYWERFGAIAFEPSQKSVLTACSLKSMNDSAAPVEFRCCFCFTIRRDIHNIPAIIVGNFLPIQAA